MGAQEVQKELINFLTSSQDQVGDVNNFTESKLNKIKEDNATKLADILVKLIKAVIEDTTFYVSTGSVVTDVTGQAVGIKNVAPIEVKKQFK